MIGTLREMDVEVLSLSLSKSRKYVVLRLKGLVVLRDLVFFLVFERREGGQVGQDLGILWF